MLWGLTYRVVTLFLFPGQEAEVLVGGNSRPRHLRRKCAFDTGTCLATDARVHLEHTLRLAPVRQRQQRQAGGGRDHQVGEREAGRGRQDLDNPEFPGSDDLVGDAVDRPDRRDQARLHQLRPGGGGRRRGGEDRQRQVRDLHGQEAWSQGIRSSRGHS